MSTPCRRASGLAAVSLVIGILNAPDSVHAGYIGAVTNTPGIQHFWLLDEPGTPAQSVDLVGGKVATHMKGFPTNAVAAGPASAPGPRPSDGFAGMPTLNNALQYTISTKTRSFVENPDEVGGKSFAAGDMTGLTVECWYKRNNVNDEGIIFGYHETTDPRYGFTAVLRRDGNNQPPSNIRVYIKDSNNRQPNYLNDTPADTDWHHLAMTWDGRYLKTFIDGAESDASVSSSAVSASGAIKSLDEFVFGGDASSQNIRYFGGALDKVAVYDRPLTSTQISRHYQAAVSGSYTMPLLESETLALQPCHYWQFEEPYGTSVLDSIENWTCTARGSLFKQGTPGLRPPAYQGFDTGNCAATFVRTNGCGAFITNSIIDTLAPGQVFSQGTVTSLTMSVWFRLGEEGPANVRQVIAGFQRKSGNRYSFMVCRENTGALKPYLAYYGGEQQLSPSPYSNITDNDWHHFVMTWDGAALRTYLDGGSEKTYTDANVSGALRSSDGFYIGMDSNNGNYFEGQIDEVALFNTTLTAEQVLSLYRAAKRGKPVRGTVLQLTSASPGAMDMPAHGVCAHRGAMSTHPENTLAAFHESIRLGAHMIEFDVAFSKDSRMVLMHDDTVDRTTDGSGRVADLTFEQLRALDAGVRKGAAFAGERIPTLEETLAIMPMNVWLNVHIKGDAQLAVAVASEIMRQERAHQAFIATGRAAATAASQLHPAILICNMERQGYDTAYVDDTINHQDAFLQLFGQVASAGDTARLKAAGVRVNCFLGTGKPNRADELAALFNAGVEFPLVDDLAPMVEAARALGIKPLAPRYRVSS